MSGFRIGVDFGGTKIEAVALDAAGQEQLRQRVATPSDDYPAIIEAIGGLVDSLEQELGATAQVGVGTPGSESPRTGRLRNSNTVCANGRPIRQDLQRRLGRAVRLANDANCFALAEAVQGAGAGADVVFGVIVGTGVGGGVVVNQRPLIGCNRIGGEWGHNPLPGRTDDERPGPDCYCGRRGCVETYLSGPALAADHRRATGQPLQPEEIAGKAAQGNAACQASLDRYVDRMARSLAVVINLLDPDVIVLGGGLSKLGLLYDRVPQRWERYVFSDSISTALRPPELGDSAGVLGAAWLWQPESVVR